MVGFHFNILAMIKLEQVRDLFFQARSGSKIRGDKTRRDHNGGSQWG